MPAWWTAAGRELRRGPPFGDAREGGGRGGIRIPGDELGYHRGVQRIKPQALGSARALGIQDNPIGRDGPGQPWATRHMAWRPRRLRAAIEVRADAAPAARLWSSR
jgi:hypothetical protein